ncbi:hypothetical protein Tco_0538377 [Tanacetum coccineum]
MLVHNHKDHLGKFDAKADDGYFLGYSLLSKAFIVFNTRRQQFEETYHITFDKSMEAIRFSNTSSVDEIRINDSSKYPPDDFNQQDYPSRHYQIDSNISYYIIPYNRSFPEIIDRQIIPKVMVPTQQNLPHTEEHRGFPDPPNTEGTKTHGGLVPYTKASPQNISESPITHHAPSGSFSNTHPQDKWSRDQHIEFVNIIGDLGEGMLTRSMAAKLTFSSASASKCLFDDFLSETKPKKVYEALKHL